MLSVGDAARYFSGVLIKDYGGVGGLKTISVRSLGAGNTGVIYDGIPVTDIQTGQTDLSRFPASLIHSITLLQASPSDILTPAKNFASPSLLSIQTNTYEPVNFANTKWKGGVNTGSFGLWHPFASGYFPAGKNMVISVTGDAVFSKGDYPYRVNNENFSEKLKRVNSEVKSFQGEMNLVKQFSDSSLFQAKLRLYNSNRALPGSIVFFNTGSHQRLWNSDVFFQSRYRKNIDKKTQLLISAKYSHTYTRYIDPDFLNGSGGLDDRYKQDEYYLSGAISRGVLKNLAIAFATDVSQNNLFANTNNFVKPTRFGMWNNVALKYSFGDFLFNASLLNTFISDRTRSTTSGQNRNRLTPTASLSYSPKGNTGLLFRLFFKEAYRMPTFNDQYYNFIGNRNLNPETSRQCNLGITWSKTEEERPGIFKLSADGYFNKISDKIIAVPNQNLFNWTMLNLGSVVIRGVDVNMETNVPLSAHFNWFSRIAYTYQQATDVTDPASANYKNRIPYTPDNSGSALSIFRYKKWSFSYSILFSGQRYTLGTNNPANRLGGWATQDFSVSRTITFNQFETHLKMGMNNLFNKQYDIVRYFPMPGRNLFIGITFNNL